VNTYVLHIQGLLFLIVMTQLFLNVEILFNINI